MAVFGFNFKSLSNLLPSQSAAREVGSVSETFNKLSSQLFSTGVSFNAVKSFASKTIDSLLEDSDQARISWSDLQNKRNARSATGNDPAEMETDLSTLPVIYPSNLSDREYFSIEFSKYDRPSPVAPPKFEPNSIIHLPLPANLTENFKIKISSEDTGIVGALGQQLETAISETMQLFGKDATATPGSIKDYINDAVGAQLYNLTDLGYALESSLGLKGATATLGQAAGVVPNPHLSMFFRGVDFRAPFTFGWLLTPKNYYETQIIKKLIYLLKRKTLPRTSTGSQNILLYPDLVRLTVKGDWNKTNTPLVPQYKYGFIESLSIDFAPKGLSFFNDSESAPTMIKLSFQFQEVEIFTASDFGAKQLDITKETISGLQRIFGDKGE